MINEKLLTQEVQQYINANLKSDLHSFLLKKSPFKEVSVQELAQQIKGRQIAEKKFPFLLEKNIIFPPHLNLEQASSQATAEYKSNLISGKSFIDLTSGLGIDAFFLSKKFEEVSLVEQNAELLEIVQHNWKVLNRNASFINDNLENFLIQNNKKFDVVYLDPARRDQQKNKVFLLEDLSPNILEIHHQLLSITDKVIIKLSPLIDLKYLISELPSIYRIDIVALKNEVKEVLIFLSHSQQNQKVEIRGVNLETQEEDFVGSFNEESQSQAKFSDPQAFLYIPNNSILKSGFFNLLCTKFNLQKLHPNTHLYTSDVFMNEFPGRVLAVASIDSKSIKKGEQYNIICKNFPLKPEEVKKKYKLKDGGNQYLIFTQSISGKIILKSI